MDADEPSATVFQVSRLDFKQLEHPKGVAKVSNFLAELFVRAISYLLYY
jgi:hypothetical protein